MTDGRIFLADKHFQYQDDNHQIISVFNQSSFENIQILDYINLAGGKKLQKEISFEGQIAILPITGAVSLGDIEIDVEQSYVSTISKSDLLTVTNLFDEDISTFILIGISTEKHISKPVLSCFDMNLRNQLLPISLSISNAKISIAFFDGRAEIIHSIDRKANFLMFTILGAFEAEGRLLHQFDALSLENTKTFEVEALSNNATLLVLELP